MIRWRSAANPGCPTAQFRIASVTKTCTAVLVLQLVDDGILTLDDTVRQWLDNPVVVHPQHRPDHDPPVARPHQ